MSVKGCVSTLALSLVYASVRGGKLPAGQAWWGEGVRRRLLVVGDLLPTPPWGGGICPPSLRGFGAGPPAPLWGALQLAV